MPLIDITNPDVIKFLVESYDKTTRLRIKWNKIHAEKLKHAASLTREEKGHFESDVIKSAMIQGMPAITRDFIASGRNRRRTPIRDGPHINAIADLMKEHSIPAVGLGDPKVDPRLARPDSDLSWDPVMRPVKTEHKEIIYKGRPVFGREVYLKTRNKMSPEQKFYFAECGGWQYGWRLKDSAFGNNAPSYGRVFHLSRNLKSRTGPHPDPLHYQTTAVTIPTKCPL